MQALSSYSPDKRSVVEAALRSLEDWAQRFTAKSHYTARGMFACFVWPDWPPALASELDSRVDAFHTQHPGLQPVQAGTPEWDGVFRGWRSDPESALAIAGAFTKHFGDRVLWVESEKDTRGRIGAKLRIEGLGETTPPPPETPLSLRDGWRASLGEVTLNLSWKDSMAIPPGPLSPADLEAFEASIREICQWAERRIRPILDALHDRLKSLYGERFRGLYVYGSYARPDAGTDLGGDSDLDVALILTDFESPYAEIERFSPITSNLSSEHGLVISVVPIREADFKQGKTNFIRTISEYAIPVP
jgi:predicted nucleotidyltransferase